MTPQTQSKKIRNAIEPILKEYLPMGQDDPYPKDFTFDELVSYLVAAIKPLMAKEMPTDDETERKIQELDDMKAEVEKCLPEGTEISFGGSGKWEKAIRYLIKVKKKHGWTFKVLMLWIDGDEKRFEKDRISYGSLMKDPHEQLKIWMPIVHAVKETEEMRPEYKKFVAEEIKSVPNPKA